MKLQTLPRFVCIVCGQELATYWSLPPDPYFKVKHIGTAIPCVNIDKEFKVDKHQLATVEASEC